MRYVLHVYGIDGATEGELELDCQCELDAICLAFGAPSIFGHELWIGDRCRGWFDGRPQDVALGL